MKHIFLNLKRFDISPENGGVNRLAPMADWGAHIVRRTENALVEFTQSAEFVMFFPEAHLLGAATARSAGSPIVLGCQGVHREDTAKGGNFGAFTTQRTASAAREMGCACALIGHCEERSDKAGILAEAGIADTDALNRLLSKEVYRAQAAGLSVLYCIGEKAEERENWREVLSRQLDIALEGADPSRIVIAYEPIWSIGPGKTPASSETILQTARFVKEHTGGMDVVYGGGLKRDNAEMLAAIPEIDGGLIALTRFTGEIGFYPEEYLEIVRIYLRASKSLNAHKRPAVLHFQQKGEG